METSTQEEAGVDSETAGSTKTGEVAEAQKEVEETTEFEMIGEPVNGFGNTENWQTNMTATIEAVEGGVTINNGVGSFTPAQYGNQILRFQMGMDIVKWYVFLSTMRKLLTGWMKDPLSVNRVIFNLRVGDSESRYS